MHAAALGEPVDIHADGAADRGRDLASVVADLRSAAAMEVPLEPGMSVAFSGQFEYLECANARLKVVVPATLPMIFVLLFLTFDRIDEALLVMATLPFALIGGVWLLYLKHALLRRRAPPALATATPAPAVVQAQAAPPAG